MNEQELREVKALIDEAIVIKLDALVENLYDKVSRDIGSMIAELRSNIVAETKAKDSLNLTQSERWEENKKYMEAQLKTNDELVEAVRRLKPESELREAPGNLI